MIVTLLSAAVALTWLGCFGFARFSSPFDRLHCVTFVALTAGACITLAVFIADGFTDRALKVLAFFLLTLLNGAAVVHATGRAVMRRGPDAVE